MAWRPSSLVVLLLASIAAKLWLPEDPPAFSAPVLGWMQCLHAKNEGKPCFCGDGGVRLLRDGGGKAVVMEISRLRRTNLSVPVNVTTDGSTYRIQREIEVLAREAGTGTRWMRLLGEASACVQICDARRTQEL